MYNHYENWIEFRKTKPGDCETNYIFHEELSLGESADIAKIQPFLEILDQPFEIDSETLPHFADDLFRCSDEIVLAVIKSSPFMLQIPNIRFFTPVGQAIWHGKSNLISDFPGIETLEGSVFQWVISSPKERARRVKHVELDIIYNCIEHQKFIDQSYDMEDLVEKLDFRSRLQTEIITKNKSILEVFIQNKRREVSNGLMLQATRETVSQVLSSSTGGTSSSGDRLLPTDPISTTIPSNGNFGGVPPIPKPTSESTWSSESPSEWEVLSGGSSPSRGVIKVIADFDENHTNWYPRAVRVLAGTLIQSFKKNYKDDIYSLVKINDKHILIPKRLLQPFVQTDVLPPPLPPKLGSISD